MNGEAIEDGGFREATLRARKFIGVESQGMFLMVEDHDIDPGLIRPTEKWLRNKLSDNRCINDGTDYFLLFPTISTYSV